MPLLTVLAPIGRSEPGLVRLERGESNGHLGNDASHHCAQTLVQSQEPLIVDDANCRRHCAARSASTGPLELNSDLHGVKGVATGRFHNPSGTTRQQVHQGVLLPSHPSRDPRSALAAWGVR